MPLDPTIATILEQMKSREVGLTGMPIEDARVLADKGMLQMREMFGVEDVGAVFDRDIPGAEGPVRARVYCPEGYGPHGVLVYFHGGGFVFCGLDTHDQMCRMLCNRGRCVVVSVDYRLAPEHPFPAGVDDAWAVTRWIQDNAAEVHGDRQKLASLVGNLLDNAVRYAPGRSTIDVAIDATPGTLTLAVSDAGPGIPDDLRARVFESYYRIPGSSGSGSGLGLAIVREVARAHGATVAIGDGPAGQGTTVRVSFPRA